MSRERFGTGAAKSKPTSHAIFIPKYPCLKCGVVNSIFYCRIFKDDICAECHINIHDEYFSGLLATTEDVDESNKRKGRGSVSK